MDATNYMATIIVANDGDGKNGQNIDRASEGGDFGEVQKCGNLQEAPLLHI